MILLVAGAPPGVYGDSMAPKVRKSTLFLLCRPVDFALFFLGAFFGLCKFFVVFFWIEAWEEKEIESLLKP